MFASVWDPVPLGLVALWAVLGVFAIALAVRMHSDHFGVKLGASLIAIGGAGLVLMCASLDNERSRTRYMFVDEVVSEAQQLRARRLLLDVNGCVVPGSIERRSGTDDYRFQLAHRLGRPSAVIEVRYTGLLPDSFRSGAEIVAKGRLAGDGRLDVVPDGIMGKCPSKYDASAGPCCECPAAGS